MTNIASSKICVLFSFTCCNPVLISEAYFSFSLLSIITSVLVGFFLVGPFFSLLQSLFSSLSASLTLPFLPVFPHPAHLLLEPAVCLPAGLSGEQTGPVFSDNHHIACMPVPLLCLCVLYPQCPAYQLTSTSHPSASVPPYISCLTSSLSTHNASLSFFSPFVMNFFNCSCQWKSTHVG